MRGLDMALAIDPNILERVIGVGQVEAEKAAKGFLNTYYNGIDGGSCGFAWVEVFEADGTRDKKIRANSKLAKLLESMGFNKDYTGAYSLWNPSNIVAQNVDAKFAGAKAFADIINSAALGLVAYACDRLD